MKNLLKECARAVAFLLVLPAACIAGFGRFPEGFLFSSQALALIPGIIGSYLRIAYYSLTLEKGCGRNCHMQLGAYFAHPQASMGDSVGIGAYCVLGQVHLGDRTLIATGAQILSGVAQHMRTPEGRLTDEGRIFRQLNIGADCWIGAASIITADLGDQVTVAAASLVLKDVPAGSTVAGNPARVVRIPTAAEDTKPSADAKPIGVKSAEAKSAAHAVAS